MKTLVFLITSICFSVVHAVDHPEVNPTTFCYNDPACGPNSIAWTGMCHSGQEQSPIDIEWTGTQNLKAQPFTSNGLYQKEMNHHFYGQNNGHSVQFEFTSNISQLSSLLQIKDGGLGSVYTFAQLHFHWGENDTVGSEHTINGKQFPMELHMVHYKSIYSSLAEALLTSDREAVAVMAVLFRVVSTGETNVFMKSILEAVTRLGQPDNIVTDFNLPLTLGKLYPSNRDYVRYMGSLTTPTCDQKVIWTVFLNPVNIHEKEMFLFRALRNAEMVSASNYRPVQPLFGRLLEYFKG